MIIEAIKNMPRMYAHFLTTHSTKILVASVIITVLMLFGATLITSEGTSYRGMLPKTLPSAQAFTSISDEFGESGQSASIIIQITDYKNSVMDVREPEVIEYINGIEQQISKMQFVSSTGSMASAMRSLDNGNLPKTKSSAIEIMNKGKIGSMDLFANYVSSDYTLAVISVNTAEMTDSEQKEFANNVNQVIENSEKPPSISVRATGDIFISQSIQDMIGPETGTLTMIAFIAILMLLFLIFTSVRYGLISMIPIVFGTLWFFGTLGFLGWSLSSELVGIFSMVMGVGVDFGIQLVTRYRLEKARYDYEDAMRLTLKQVMVPMITTTIAILAGFKALSFGQLSMLAKMGDMLGIGVLMCFIVAMTVLPGVLMLLEKRKQKKQIKEFNISKKNRHNKKI